jgi:hypothetical protein
MDERWILNTAHLSLDLRGMSWEVDGKLIGFEGNAMGTERDLIGFQGTSWEFHRHHSHGV